MSKSSADGAQRRARGGRFSSDLHPRYESARPARIGAPTDAVPGTPEKEAVLTARFADRESLFVAGDLIDADRVGQAAAMLEAVLGHAPPEADPDELHRLHRKLLQRGRRNLFQREKHLDLEPGKISCEIDRKDLQKLTTPTPGGRIREARLAAKMSMRRLARLCGLDHSALSLIERQFTSPRLETLRRVARALGTSLDRLACIERDPQGAVRVSA